MIQQTRINRGAYDRPFSGVGIEYDPLGVEGDQTGLTLHEAGYLAANADWNFPGVFSPFWRLYYNFDRGHCVLFGERVIELTPVRIVLIPPHCLFHCLGANPVRTLWLSFSFTRRLHPDLIPPVQLKLRETEHCLIQDLRRLILADRNYEPTEAILRHSLALLHVTLSRPELRWQPPIVTRLEAVQKYIEGHLHTKLLNQELAKAAGMSTTGLNNAFRTCFGTSPARYIAQMRVRKAAQLLLEGDHSIDEIAVAAGFCDRAHFSHVFKKLTDQSPATFRRRHQRLG